MKFKTSKKIFAHIDCDSFFASCEIFRNPKLRGKYVCVGGDIIVAATYNAKKMGVKVGIPIWEARKILRGKEAYFCTGDMALYKKISNRLMDYLQDHTMDVRIFSIDEAFVEITGLPEMYNISLEIFLKNLQKNILRIVGIPVSIGVSNTRLKAKIFSKIHKPYGICVGLDSQTEKKMFDTLSFRDIPFIGSATAKKLDYYVQTISQYIDLGYFEIVRRFGKNGGKIWLELRGVSSMGFLPKKQAKSIGRSRSFHKEMSSNPQILLEKIRINLEKIFRELHIKHYEVRHISLLLIDKNWEKYTGDFSFETYTHDKKKIFRELQKLFFQIYTPEKCYRKTGVFFSDIRSFDTKQLSIFTHTNKDFYQQVVLENMFQELRKKYEEGVLYIGAKKIHKELCRGE